MGLKQIKESDRLIFVNRFVKEMLIYQTEKDRTKQRIEDERLKRKLFGTQPEEILGPVTQPESNQEYGKSLSKPMPPRKRMIYRKNLQTPVKPARPLKPMIMPKQKPRPGITPKPVEIKPVQDISNTTDKPGMSVINPLIKDATILSIECPGPGKYLMIRRNRQTNIVKMSLSQKQITDVINDFSARAKIPVIGGIFKAAVGNVVISAVVSEFVGSRFIINKLTPYSILDKS